MRGRVIYTDTIVSVWLRLAKNNGLDEEVYGMIVNGGDDGDVSRHSSPSFGICVESDGGLTSGNKNSILYGVLCLSFVVYRKKSVLKSERSAVW